MFIHIKRKKMGDALEYLIVIYMLIATATPILSTNYSAVVIGYLFLGCIANLILRNTTLDIAGTVCACFLCALLLITMMVNFDKAISHYAGIICIIIGTLLTTNVLTFNSFKNRYIIIVTIISVYSVLLTIYSNINLQFVATLPTLKLDEVNYWNSFYNIYFYWGWSPYTLFIRNSACFREPGVFGCIVGLALALKINEMPERPTKKTLLMCGVLVAGGLSTLSTTTIFAIAICILMYFSKTRAHSFDKLFVFIIVLIGIVAFILPHSDILFAKLFKGSSSYISLEQRNQGMLYGVEKFCDNPIFGVGYTQFYTGLLLGTSANSFTDALGKYGFIFCGVICFYITKWARKTILNKTIFYLLLVEMLILLMSENLLMYPVFLSLAFYGMKRNGHIEGGRC